ncbi:MAG TPA: hypothetical protein VFJ85_17195 [Acidimicrobiales bacterium]|nr:hypothetical protein [Acidimicrobiales bacterium]
MARFVLRYRGDGSPPAADVAAVRDEPGVVVVESSGRMVLVEAEPGTVEGLRARLAEWLVAPEQTYQVPDTRRKVEGPPD